MKIHKEGHRLLITLLVVLILINLLIRFFWPAGLVVTGLASLIFYLSVLQFFRDPKREIQKRDDQLVYAPADGKVVVIETTEEQEYFNDKRIQVSIFMSPTNVHINRNPVSGKVNYFKYHPGKYLVAWHPKSSTENERTTVVIDNGKQEILLRQIAGAMAKRIKTYLQVGENVVQGEDLGFIKFGSRVDILLPLDAIVKVEIGQKVKGNQTIIAQL
ncbi:MAG: phosphatidylserine decarboxylase [Saprospiraceae bacterium]|nr:MAG: phosphatidylserine decarboxylase [Saprospiraceae bacterium]